MADWTRIGELPGRVGQEVTVRGWLYNKRSSGKIHFLEVRDGSGIVQCIAFQKEVSPELFEKAGHVTQESSIEVTGTVREEKRAPGGVELGLTGLEVRQPAADYPIGKKEHGPDFLLSHRHLWLRSKQPWAILRIRDTVIRSIRNYLHEQDFLNVDAPIFTPAACEGTTTLFEVEYFEDEKAYLTQSGQLYGEATAMAHGKTYCFGPTFRAEKSKTRRHLTEFWMVEPEAAYYELDDVMRLAEGMVCRIADDVLKERRPELEMLGRDPLPLEKVKAPFPRISYTEAVERIRSAGETIEWGEDFGAPHETALSNQFDRPVMVHRYPAAVKAFYMKRDAEDDKLALGVDVIAPEGYGEIVGGGQREDSLEALEERIAEHDLPKESFEWFLDLRRYGSVPHGGFGLGLERTLAWICGREHVRETIPFPRMMHRIYP